MPNIFKSILLKSFKKVHLILLILYSFVYTIPKLYFLSRSKNEIKLEFGSGPFVYSSNRNQYLTCDIFFNCDLPWDARIPMPFLKNKVSSIYSSHFLEHLNFYNLKKHFRYCSGYLLKKNGKYLISVPNAKLYIKAYYESRQSELLSLAWKPGLTDTGSLIDQVNYIAYMNGEHKILFDKEFLSNSLLQNGFRLAKQREFNPEIDLPSRHFESIYCVAQI